MAAAGRSTYTSPTSPACKGESCACSVSSHKPTGSAWSRDQTIIRRNHPSEVPKTGFNASLKVDYRGSRVTSDGSLILVGELDERLGLEKLIEEHLSSS
jgi:hypothetical protein